MKRRFRLIPDDPELGLTPFGWLVYLLIFALPLYLAPYSPTYKAAGTVALICFLALYLRGFWVRGRQMVWIVIAITAIGVAFLPTNPGASVFFVYSAAFLGEAFPRRFAYRALAILIVVLATTSVVFRVTFFGWLPAAVFSVLVFLMNAHQADVRRRNARLHLAQEEVERLARLGERERIARDLHDLLGHTLSVITLKSQLAARLAESDPERAASEMREVETISRDATNEIRQTVRGYRFQQLGAELAKAGIALEVANIELHADTAPFDLPAEHESVLALALREGVTNVVRHSKARHCWIDFSTETGDNSIKGFRLVIEDDGRGPHRERLVGQNKRTRFGTGLEGMTERLGQIDGRLEISASHERGGTRLEVFVPARHEDERTGPMTGAQTS